MPVGGNFTPCNCGSGTACQSPTEPVATVGLCLADGSPIAVTVVRDCAGTVTSEGWIDLATGAWSAGAPPAGTIACGDSRSIQVSGVFCDVDDDGLVLGLVLVEYAYAADGSIAAVRLVDAVTGATYTPQGTVTTCPAGVEQPERDMLQLCDTTDDESGLVVSVPFLRDYARDENGAITGHSDYTLDGAPYTPSGTVGVCGPAEEPCRDSSTVLLCDDPAPEGVPPLPVASTVTDTDPTPTFFTSHNAPLAGGGQALWDGGTLTFPAEPDNGATGGPQVHRVIAGVIQPAAPECDDGTATVTVEVNVTNTGPFNGVLTNGRLRLLTPDGVWLAAQTVSSVDAGETRHLAVTGVVPAATVTAGQVLVSLDLETWDQAGSGGEARAPKSWDASGFVAAVAYGQAGCVPPVQFLRTLVTDCETGLVVSTMDTNLDGEPYEVTGEVGQCTAAGATPVPVERPHMDTELVVLCDTPEDGEPVPFLRRVVFGSDGQPVQVTDTGLDGIESYVPTGVVGTCAGGEPCRNSSSTLLCDTSAADLITVFDPANVAGPDGWEVISFVSTKPDAQPEGPLPYPAIYGTPYGYPALGARTDQSAGYGGGSWTTYDAAPLRWVIRKTFTAPEDGVAIAQSTGFRGDGGARVRINGQDAGMYGQWNQPATSGTAQIPVTAGINTVEIEVRDVGGINNVVGKLDIALPRTVQFIRHQTVDCETGEVISTTDTTLDGQPYEVTGEVGQCQTVSECCEQPPPELRVDIESDVLCIRDAGGEITGQVVVERVYDDQSGERVVQRLTDPTTGDPVVLPDGAELVLCQEPPCPAAFSTECVGAVTRTEAGYDNTSLIGGVPGQCGSVQGPNGQFPCQPVSGGYTIISWIVNGEEVIGEGGGRAFAGGPCGEGTSATPGMHHNWAQALTNLDPSGASWSAQQAEGCAWFVGSTGGAQTVYGPMTIVDAAGQQWILGPAQACEEIQFTKVYSQQCDGTVTVSWLDAQGVETDAPEGDLVPCGTGCGAGGGAGLDIELVALCDVQADGTAVSFLRHITYGSAGQVSVVIDTGLDGFSPYSPSGTVGVCQPQPDGQDVELLPMCVIDNASGAALQQIVAEARYDAESGERTGVTYVDPVTWGPVAMPGGTHIGLCPEAGPAPDAELLALCDVTEDGTTQFLRHLIYQAGATAPTVLDTALDGATPYLPSGEVRTCEPTQEECPSRTVISACRCDDTDGDGIADTEYVELLAVDCEGVLTSVGTYTEDLSAPYTPVAPVDCATADPGPEPVVSVQAHRVQLDPGQSWDASAVAALRSVTLTAHTGDGQVTTADGVSTLFRGESVSWSADKDTDAMLTGPLAVKAVDGVITVTWTRTS